MDETKLLIAKTEDLAETCRKNCYPDFSKFMDERARQLVKNVKAPGCKYHAYGGYDGAERKMIGCFPEGYEPLAEYFPLSAVKITPSDPSGLTHRDYLGSVLGLGINRDCIGDIVVSEKSACVFCADSVKNFILTNLDRIGRCSATAEETLNPEIPEKKLKRKSITAASNRLDCILSAVIGTSRSKTEELIKAGRVMVNFTEAMSVHLKLKANDTVSVRGYGRFIYAGDCGTTKKGRIKVEIDIYE